MLPASLPSVPMASTVQTLEQAVMAMYDKDIHTIAATVGHTFQKVITIRRRNGFYLENAKIRAMQNDQNKRAMVTNLYNDFIVPALKEHGNGLLILPASGLQEFTTAIDAGVQINNIYMVERNEELMQSFTCKLTQSDRASTEGNRLTMGVSRAAALLVDRGTSLSAAHLDFCGNLSHADDGTITETRKFIGSGVLTQGIVIVNVMNCRETADMGMEIARYGKSALILKAVNDGLLDGGIDSTASIVATRPYNGQSPMLCVVIKLEKRHQPVDNDMSSILLIVESLQKQVDTLLAASKPRHTKIDHVKVIDLYQSGKRACEIAKELGVNYKSVHWILTKSNLLVDGCRKAA